MIVQRCRQTFKIEIMAHYTQVFIQFVFATKWRECLIPERRREEVERYLCGIVEKKNSKPIAVYCNPDHVHILMRLHPTVAISEMARVLKCNVSKWINENQLTPKRFSWQGSYGAFSYSRSSVPAVKRYILNQKEHHKHRNFKEEYLALLKEYGLENDPRYGFDFPE